MASTSLTLGTHWEDFIRREVESGRYASASEVVRAALRELEERQKKIEALRAHLAEGVAQADRGEFVEPFTVDELIERAEARLKARGLKTAS
ncbi:MAG: type II toxin-antitoxin system ParD family antitoxin [Caulobacterales bacterium]